MEFDEKTKWAINILIAYAVYACKGLHCDEDCPLYDDEKGDCDDAVWNDEDIVNAVKWLNGRES
jgi:hypothetical protein